MSNTDLGICIGSEFGYFFLVNTDVNIFVEYGSGCLDRIQIWLCSSDRDLGILVGYVSGYFGRTLILVFWSDSDLGICIVSKFGYFWLIRIWVILSYTDLGIRVGSGSWCLDWMRLCVFLFGYGSGYFYSNTNLGNLVGSGSV